MKIEWCDYCGSTKDVKYIVEIDGNTYDFCEYCYKYIKSEFERKKEQNRKKVT